MVFNGAQIHLMLNHLPIIGFFGMVIALAYALKTTSIDIKRFVLIATAVVGLSSITAFRSGEPAEETIEHLAGVDKGFIEEHEEAAEFATTLAVITAAIAIVSLILERRKPALFNKGLITTLLFSVVTAVAMAKTGHEGGKIRHPEIRGSLSPSTGQDSSVKTEDKDKDDD